MLSQLYVWVHLSLRVRHKPLCDQLLLGELDVVGEVVCPNPIVPAVQMVGQLVNVVARCGVSKLIDLKHISVMETV
jgi:hypothetical protein